MFKHLLKIFTVVILAVAISGCTVRHYTQRKERVDQEMTGNAGYLGGTPPPGATDRGPHKTTRKIYVWEIQSKDKKQDEEMAAQSAAPSRNRVDVSEESGKVQRPTIVVPREVLEGSGVSEPVIPPAAESAGVAGAALPAEYTIEKGDTLQKISKKFYDTYRKWNKIYEANKGKIKDPNRVKPGVTITIPAL